VKYLDVPSFFPNGAPLASKRLVAETGQDEASSCEQACPLAGGGFLTYQMPQERELNHRLRPGVWQTPRFCFPPPSRLYLFVL